MNADGSNQRRLTDSADNDGEPSWSPDGTKIAFLRSNRFGTDLHVMNADGSDQRIIGHAFTPFAWSPDGAKLVVASYELIDLHVVYFDGKETTQLTAPPANGVEDIGIDTAPSWSPDDSQIVFTRYRGCNIEGVECKTGQIWVVNADGSDLKKLIDDGAGAFAEQPVWSPDGTKIIFNEGGNLFEMNVDGSGLTNLSNGKAKGERDLNPSWATQLVSGSAASVSATSQSFAADGGSGSVEVTANPECGWTAASNVGWISITSAGIGSGYGVVNYSVAANPSTAPRTGVIVIAARLVLVTQAGVPVRITSAAAAGKKLLVFGENFDPGAVILLNGQEQITVNDGQNPKTTLISKKAGKKIRAGDRVQVRNPNGTLSQEFTFSGV